MRNSPEKLQCQKHIMKYVIAGNYGANNIGDEMILRGLLKDLKSKDKKAIITVLSAKPEETATLHNIKSLEKLPAGLRSLATYTFKDKTTKKAIKNCDIFVLGGGGLFGNLTFKANIIWALQALAAIRHKKRIFLLGQSIGPLTNPVTKWIVKKVFSNAEKITVRDKKSIERLSKIGITNNVILQKDFAFKTTIKPSKRKKQIVISLRNTHLPKNFVKNTAKFINEIAKKGYKIIFIDMQSEGKEGDACLHRKIIDELSPKAKIMHLTAPTIEEVEEAISQSKAVIGMRLHSIITAIKAKTPFIAISYANKVEDLLESLNMKETMIHLKDVTAKKLSSIFHKTL